jgi:uncharacterized protein YeaC (DUF1315 family)
MTSDFLKKLSESLETGKADDGVKTVFNEILDKGDKYAANPNIMKDLREKVKEITKEEERMLVKEQKANVTSAVIMLKCEIEELEVIVNYYKNGIHFLQEDKNTYKEKKEIINELISEINFRKSNIYIND